MRIFVEPTKTTGAGTSGWSSIHSGPALAIQIESGLYHRQGRATTNFETTLPEPDSDLAQQTLKDPYVFEFLVDYALSDTAKPVSVAGWTLTKDLPPKLVESLPTVEMLEDELAEVMSDESDGDGEMPEVDPDEP